MHRSEVEPNVVTHGAAVAVCADSMLWTRAVRLLNEFPMVLGEPSFAVCNTVVGSCASATAWTATLLLLQHMRSQTIAMSCISYMSAAVACENSGHFHVLPRLLCASRRWLRRSHGSWSEYSQAVNRLHGFGVLGPFCERAFTRGSCTPATRLLSATVSVRSSCRAGGLRGLSDLGLHFTRELLGTLFLRYRRTPKLWNDCGRTRVPFCGFRGS